MDLVTLMPVLAKDAGHFGTWKSVETSNCVSLSYGSSSSSWSWNLAATSKLCHLKQAANRYPESGMTIARYCRLDWNKSIVRAVWSLSEFFCTFATSLWVVRQHSFVLVWKLHLSSAPQVPAWSHRSPTPTRFNMLFQHLLLHPGGRRAYWIALTTYDENVDLIRNSGTLIDSKGQCSWSFHS